MKNIGNLSVPKFLSTSYFSKTPLHKLFPFTPLSPLGISWERKKTPRDPTWRAGHAKSPRSRFWRLPLFQNVAFDWWTG